MIVLCLLFYSVLGCKIEADIAEPIEKPNILWLVLEDMSPQFVGAYGNETARTPVIDSLINVGTRFDAAFSTGAVCSPSRYTIITGTRTFEYGTGHHRSNYPIPDFVEPFPKFLKDSGYHTSNNSKRDYNTSARQRITKSAWVESSNKAGWWNRKDQPFFSVFNFDNCHQSRTFTNPYENYKTRILDKLEENEIIAPEDIMLPDFYKDTPALRKELSRTYNAMKKTDKEVDSLLKRLEKDGLTESTIIFIYSDHGGGALRTKSKGIALGHQVPLAVIFPEKYKKLNPFKDEAATSQPITFEDLGPTVLSLANIEIPQYMTGKPFLGTKAEKQEYAFCSSDRCGESYDLTRSISDGTYFYTRVFMPGKPQMGWQKYFDYSESRQLARRYFEKDELDEKAKQPFEIRPKEFLYHLKNDKWQTTNLAGDAQHEGVLKKLRAALEKKLLDVKDVHFIPEYALDSISKTTVPFDFKESEEYDFESVYHLANLIGFDSNISSEQLEALQNQNPLLRYWALLGLSESPKAELDAIKLEKCLKDSFPPNQIIAASILYKMFDSVEGRERLRQYLSDDNPLLAEHAIQQIIYLPKTKAMSYAKDIELLSSEFEEKNQSNNITESLDIFLYRYMGKDLVYEKHW